MIIKNIILLTAVFVSGIGYCGESREVTILPGKTVELEECVKMALESNPNLRVAGADVLSKEADAGLAASAYYPTLGVRGLSSRWQSRIFLPDQFAASPDMSDIVGPTYDVSTVGYVRYMIYDFGVRGNEAKAARAIADSATNSFDSARQNVVMAAHFAFYKLAIAEELKVVASNAMGNAAYHLELAQKRRAVNDVTDADVLRAQARFDDTSSDNIKASSEVRAAVGDLNYVLGSQAGTVTGIRAGGDVTGGSLIVPDYTNLLTRAYFSRGELKVAESALEATRRKIKAAKSDYAPKIYGDANYGWRDDSYSLEDETWFAGVTVEMTLFEGLKNNRKLDKTKAEYDKCLVQLSGVRNEISKEVWNACAMIEEAVELERATATAEKDSEESLRMVSERYKVGGAAMSDLLDAQTALSSAKARHVRAKWNCRMADVNLRRSIGELK